MVKLKSVVETCNNITVKNQTSKQRQGSKRIIVPQTEFVIPEKMKDLYNEVDAVIHSIDDRIEQTKMAVYIKYTIDDKNICTISGNNSKLKMCFNVDIDELSDPHNLLEDVSQKGHHGIGNTRIVFNDNSNINEIESFLRQMIAIL